MNKRLGFSSRFFGDDVFNRLLKNGSLLLGSSSIVAVISLVQGIIIARILGAASYGLLAMVFAYVNIVNGFIDFRAWEACTKYISEFWAKGEKEKSLATLTLCYLIDLVSGVIAFIIIVISAKLAASLFFQRPELSGLMMLYGCSLLFLTVNSTSSALLRVFDKYLMLSLYDIFKAIITLSLILLFLSFGLGLRGIVLGYVLSALIGGLVKTVMAINVISKTMWHNRKKAINLSILKGRFREIVKFLIHTNVGSSLVLATRNIDVMILGYFRAPAEVGYFKLAKSFVSYLPRLSDPFYIAVFPELSKLWAKEQRKEIIQLFKKATVMIASIAIPVAIVVSTFSTQIILFTAGRDFLPAAIAIRIMIIGTVIAVLFFWAHPACLAIGRADAYAKVNAVSLAFVISLGFILIPTFGFIGSAIDYVIAYLVGHVLTIRIIMNTFKTEHKKANPIMICLEKEDLEFGGEDVGA